MKKTNKKKDIQLLIIIVRILAISASTLAFYDFLKGEFQTCAVLSMGWLLIVVAEKRILHSIHIKED